VPYLPAFQIGGAGSAFVDPFANETILRATDETTRNGDPFATPSNSSTNTWATDDQHFFAEDASTGEYYLFGFNPNSFPPTSTNLGVLAGDYVSLGFGFVDPNTIYGVVDATLSLESTNILTGAVTVLFDPTTSCHGLVIPTSPRQYVSDYSGSADDQTFSFVITPQQDAGYIAVVWNRSQGCRWINTQTLQAGGSWGPVGAITGMTPVFLHDAEISPDGSIVSLSMAGSYTLNFWAVASNSVDSVPWIPADCTTGHAAMGYNTFYNECLGVVPDDWISRQIANPLILTHLVNPLPSSSQTPDWIDEHISANFFQGEQGADTNPICMATSFAHNTAGIGALPNAKEPWENEIICIQPVAPYTIWRFAHTFSEYTNGFYSSPRGNLSQDGHFYAFSSDYEDELGLDTTKTTLTYRTDVFVAALR